MAPTASNPQPPNRLNPCDCSWRWSGEKNLINLPNVHQPAPCPREIRNLSGLNLEIFCCKLKQGWPSDFSAADQLMINAAPSHGVVLWMHKHWTLRDKYQNKDNTLTSKAILDFLEPRESGDMQPRRQLAELTTSEVIDRTVSVPLWSMTSA